jgi:hypothetical protein
LGQAAFLTNVTRHRGRRVELPFEKSRKPSFGGRDGYRLAFSTAREIWLRRMKRISSPK